MTQVEAFKMRYRSVDLPVAPTTENISFEPITDDPPYSQLASESAVGPNVSVREIEGIQPLPAEALTIDTSLNSTISGDVYAINVDLPALLPKK